MQNPIRTFTRNEWILWIASLALVLISNLTSPDPDLITLAAALIGVTSLVLAAKGSVWAQFLMVVFSILYGILSFRFRYWGEMLTYLGMSLPMSVWSAVTWFKNPSESGDKTVKIRSLTCRHVLLLTISCIAATALFSWILWLLDTPNLLFSTISVATSFLAAALTMLRSSYYAAGYAANDLVLIILWVMASMKDPAYLPVVVNFAIFFVNDLYGFFRWKKRELQQA